MNESRGKQSSLVILLILILLLPLSATAQQEEVSPEEEAADVAAEEADDQVRWEFSARVRPRLEARFNHHFGLDAGDLNYSFQPDEADAFSQQSRLGVRAERGALTGKMTLQHTAVWGEFGGNQLTLAPLGLYEGWLRYDFNENFLLDVGRFELAYGDERVLGAVGWSQVGRAWDGLRLGIRPTEGVGVDVFAARYHNRQAQFLDGDAFLTGAYASFEELAGEFLAETDLYLLVDVRWDADLITGTDEMPFRRLLAMIGSRLHGNVADADWTLEGGYQLGNQCFVDEDRQDCIGDAQAIGAYFFDVEAGYSVAGARPFLGFSMASGNDPDTENFQGYDQLYPTGHRWLGYMDLVGPRTNLREIRAGVSYRQDWFTGQLAVHDFTRLQPQIERVGTEFNTKLGAAVGDGFALQVGHGLFLPAQGISQTDADPDGVANWSFVQFVGAF